MFDIIFCIVLMIGIPVLPLIFGKFYDEKLEWKRGKDGRFYLDRK